MMGLKAQHPALDLPWALLMGLTLASHGSTALSQPGPLQVELSPTIGTGSLSSGDQVRHVTGYDLGVASTWSLGPWVRLGPLVTLGNHVISARASKGDRKTVSTYDNRTLALGLVVKMPDRTAGTWLEGLYASASAGRVMTKLTVSDASPRTFTQSLFSNIGGTEYAGELGTWFPLKEDFGLNVAMVAKRYVANQSKATGTFEGEELTADDSLRLRSGSSDAASGQLAPQLTMATYSAKVGLVFKF